MEDNTITSTEITTAGDVTTQNTEQTTTTEPGFKTFATEADYNNAVKSERSKAKNEILQELGLSNVAEAKTALTNAGNLAAELTTTKDKASKLEETLALTKLGIKDAYAEEALALAKGKVNDKVDLSAALTQVAEKFPVMLGKSIVAPAAVGGEKKGNTAPAEEGTLKANLSKKYPWLKF